MGRVGATRMLIRGLKTASVTVAEQAISAGASVDGIPAISQVPPICFASNYGYVDIIKVLVDSGADLEVATGDGCNSTEALLVWFDGDSSRMGLNRSRALHAAIYGGKVEALRVLLEAGANPNSTDADGSTPLMIACTGFGPGQPYCDAEQCCEILHALLNAGADPTTQGTNGGLAIHYAADFGATHAVKILLAKAPSTINYMDDDGRTPLGAAAYKGQASTVSFLLSAGAREPAPWMAGMRNSGALHFTVQANQQHVMRILCDEGLEAVGGVLAVPEAIRNSIQWESIGVLRALLNVQGEERQAFWANHNVYHSRQCLFVEIPVQTPHVLVNAIMAARFGSPMLHVAARYCSLRAVRVLLSAGADETAVDIVEGKHASDVVGDLEADDKKNTAKESALRRMLQRGPAFRARSWAWTTETHPVGCVAPDITVSNIGGVPRVALVRVSRAEGTGGFSKWCARFAVKGDLPFLRLPLSTAPGKTRLRVGRGAQP